jgi:B12-binding domain/radical SAM domain protein of rhizo-twelve system
VLKKLGVDVVIVGECEDVLVKLARTPRSSWSDVSSIALRPSGVVTRSGEGNRTDMRTLPALRWPQVALARHVHHHHRFDCMPEGPGAEIEASRNLLCHGSSSAKHDEPLRRRPLEVILEELDGLLASGVRYVYFIDEAFLPDHELLTALSERDVSFGVQLRIESWSRPMLELLGRAGCISIEGELETIADVTRAERVDGADDGRPTTTELVELFALAKSHVPFVGVQVTASKTDSEESVRRRDELRRHGVLVHEPVPPFPYPGSTEYRDRFGACDDDAWERAHAHYIAQFEALGEMRESAPMPLPELERGRV